MGGAQKKVNLDRLALRMYLAEHKIRANKLSLEMGWANNYLTECIRDTNPKPMNLASYKYLCTMLKVPEDTFILKENSTSKKDEVAENRPVIPQTIQVQGGGLSDGQFNALIQAISTLTDTLNKTLNAIATAQQSNSVISGKIYGEVVAVADALGVHSATPTKTGSPTTPVTVKSQYSAHLGEKKNA